MDAGFVRDLQTMLAGMAPALDDAVYRFILITPDIAPQALGAALGTFRENEGVTAIIPADLADELEQSGPDFARVTLTVQSDLEGVGLTAAVATALSAEGIACNVVAAYHHDHIFVPWNRRDDTMKALSKISNEA